MKCCSLRDVIRNLQRRRQARMGQVRLRNQKSCPVTADLKMDTFLFHSSRQDLIVRVHHIMDLPQYGHKQWQSYFGRTFDVYTKLWKFQQQHRQVLDSRYGLKRWQIGEVASKIGQLYYHYYYLNEAFSFYSAIRQRSYYYQVNKEDRPELVVKKLRYYARYIVVCLLLNKMDLVKVLVKELSEEIEGYTQRFNTEDQLEWNLVLQEVAAFVEADPVLVLNDDNVVVITSNRLQEGGVPQLEQGMVVGQLTLTDALIVGNCNNQEPTEKPAKRENPHKYLLYKPTFSQLYTFLSASFKELPANSVLLIYLSATGVFPTGRPDLEGDLFPFTRKPLFVIVDSSNSTAYKRGSLFTLFLYCPLVAFLYVCGLTSMRQGLWEKAQELLQKAYRDIGQLLTHSPAVDQAYLQFYGDEFLRLLLLRFVFCSAVMRLHKLFRESRSFPESFPPLPRQETVESSVLQRHVLELATMLDVQSLFYSNTTTDHY
ncbi:hypothetical protein JZ751_005296 [Albula glossodonta]|uniref:Suppressor of cancer cell invasion n=1 Tax=Albula glossodonta TaxID=121402 RepID=A0A8T2N5V7_9TELE|nr:hypothetical protein JZ751_005296 [Albula glossodonta]